MIRVVLDANVLVSALSGYQHSGSFSVRILQVLRETELAVVVISDHIALEVGRALARPYFRDRMTGEERIWAFGALRQPPFQWIEPASVIGVASHPEDDFVIGTALAGRAALLVTSDRQLLRLSKHEHITIIDPPAFLAMIEPAS